MDTTFFSTDITDLPEATRPEVLELGDGDELQLRPGPVAKRLGDSTVRMLGYNGSIPGPTLKVRQGSEVVVHVRNDTDLDTTVHWHGLRLENRFDGVPHETQAPIPPGGEFTYRIQFPDPGLYWYHPHIREDVTQELGLYGSILVEPAEPDYWPPAHRDVVLTLDDLLLEDGVIAPFSRTETNYAAMGRYGNVMLTGGETAPAFTAKTGEVVRFWLTNTANSRVFRVNVPGARMKLVGGDSGRVEHEQFVSDVVLAPSERAVVDVLFDRAGEFALEHRTPNRTYRLAAITVTGEVAEPPLAERVRGAAHRAGVGRRAGAARRLAGRAAGQDPGHRRGDGRPGAARRPDRCLRLPDAPRGGQRPAGRCPKCGMKLMADATAVGSPGRHGRMRHDDAGADAAATATTTRTPTTTTPPTADGIEWEDDMAEMNRTTTTETMRWKLLDRTAGRDGPRSTGGSPPESGSRSGWSTRWTPTTRCTTRSTSTEPVASSS